MVNGMVPYLLQLDLAAHGLGVKLEDVAEVEGIYRSTIQRWRSGESEPRGDKVKRLFARIEKMRKAEVA